MMDIETRTVAGKSAWIIQNDTVEVSMTRLGAMIAPVRFGTKTSKPIQPYYISPWQEENVVPDEPVLVPLRGDFFCLPFGAAGEHNGNRYATHGEPATAEWTAEALKREADVTSFTAGIKTTSPPGEIRHKMQLHAGHPAVYSTHTLTGYSIETSLGHHATLAATPNAPLRITTSQIRFGMTSPGPIAPYQGGEYSALLPGTEFERLETVPTRWITQPETDCSVFPNRQGFVDILSVFQEHPNDQTPTWVAAVNSAEGYLWFSLKDPAMLPATVFWMENHGRHQEPWNGRNCCIGLEDVCGYQAEGLGPSSEPNAINERGIATTVELKPDQPTHVRYIQGAVETPKGFDRVSRVQFGDSSLVFRSEAGSVVTVPVRWEFLYDGAL